MQRIVPSLWFNQNGEEALRFYAEAFPSLKVLRKDYYPLTGLLDFQEPLAGQLLSAEFAINDFRFNLINASEEFRPNPTISFFLNFDPLIIEDARAELDHTFEMLMRDGGRELMPLDEYPFSQHYAWIEDRFGVSWQLILTDPEGDPRPFIIPNLLFGDGVQGRAKEAMEYYASVFDGTVTQVVPYPPGSGSPSEVMYGEFIMLDQWFTANDAADQDFTFNYGASLIVECTSQSEVDRYWDALSKVPEAEQCGWCADQFGLSWQIVPADLPDMGADPEMFARLLRMKKIDIAQLEGEVPLE